MRGVIHVRPKNATKYDPMEFEGDSMTVADLKMRIMKRYAITSGDGVDVAIANADLNEGFVFSYCSDNEEYTRDDIVIPNGTKVHFRRKQTQRSVQTAPAPKPPSMPSTGVPDSSTVIEKIQEVIDDSTTSYDTPLVLCLRSTCCRVKIHAPRGAFVVLHHASG
jgi:hypothetical protein